MVQRVLKRFLMWLWDDGKGTPSVRTERRGRWRSERDSLLEEISKLHGIRANLYKKIAEETGALKEEGHLGGIAPILNVDFATMLSESLKEFGIGGMQLRVAKSLIASKRDKINAFAETKLNEMLAHMEQDQKAGLSKKEAERLR